MSTCRQVRELMLEAEPDALRGVGGSTVAEHVRACRACARLADRILEETETLAAWLGDAPTVPVAEIVRGAGVAGRRRRRARWLWAPAAAAAAVAALFVALESRGPELGPAPPRTPAAPPPVVEPATSGTVAVMQTDNPDITVLWFF